MAKRHQQGELRLIKGQSCAALNFVSDEELAVFPSEILLFLIVTERLMAAVPWRNAKAAAAQQRPAHCYNGRVVTIDN